MSTELSILEKRGIDESVWSAIGSSIFPGASDEAKLLAFDYCKARGLDILKKPCHIVPMNVKDAKTGRYEWRDVIMPGIAEQRITANRTGEYAGQDAPAFGPMVEIEIGGTWHTVPESCTITVYRMIGGQRVPCSHTEYFEEACGTVKDGGLNSMWTKRKRGQLAKCAEAGALRKAFPEELGGMATADEEMVEIRDVTPPRKGLTVRETPIDPTADPADETPADEQPAEVIDSSPATIPATGKQKKDRHCRDGYLQSVTPKTTQGGKTFWVVNVNIKGKSVDFLTWSESLANDLLLVDEDAAVSITFTVGTKGDFQIEDYTLKTESE